MKIYSIIPKDKTDFPILLTTISKIKHQKGIFYEKDNKSYNLLKFNVINLYNSSECIF